MPFLYELYASTRERELAAVSWDAARKAAFLRMQFDAQHSHYQEHYPAAAFDLVLVDEVLAGRLYVDRRSDELRIIDITIVDALRNRRIGTRLLTALQREAAASGCPVRIHVERDNPAQRLYARLGFRQIEDRGVYLLLEWTPTTAAER